MVENYSDTKNDRTGIITVKAGDANPVTITITQLKVVFYNDREVVKLQSATTGKGVNIVMMGDGYTFDDMRMRTGKYERDMREAAEHFFSVYPFSRYRDHFNVFMVTAISKQEGVSVKSTGKKVDTKFSVTWDGGNSTRLDCDHDMVFKYLDAISELKDVQRDDITIVLPINADIYAGTCWMYYPTQKFGSGSGASISLCPVSRSFKSSAESDFRAVVIHEAAGHGFAKLADEYRVYNRTIPDDEKNRIINQKSKNGWYENVDFYSNTTNTSWSGFAGRAKYNMVATYEGAYLYTKGVWRSEYNSCMNDNVPYFNAPSRWAQVKRIKELAGFNYTLDQFLRDDIVPEYPEKMQTKSAGHEFVPFSSPVVFENVPTRSAQQ